LMSDLDRQIAEGVAHMRATLKFLNDQFIVEECRDGGPVEGCLSCQAIPVVDGIKLVLDLMGEPVDEPKEIA